MPPGLTCATTPRCGSQRSSSREVGSNSESVICRSRGSCSTCGGSTRTSFVRAMKEALLPLGGRSHLQYRTHLDEEREVRMRPDFVWSLDGRPRVVVDAKYKAERYDGFHRLISTNCSPTAPCSVSRGALDLRKGFRRTGVTCRTRRRCSNPCAHTDLELTPADLLAQVQESLCVPLLDHGLACNCSPAELRLWTHDCIGCSRQPCHSRDTKRRRDIDRQPKYDAHAGLAHTGSFGRRSQPWEPIL